MTFQRNRLGSEKSPYLLQHKDNPVWWQPWGAEAFTEARRRDVPVFLSVGYSTCHWCHVMEHESFEAPEVARVLNERFVAIKVDREERPDVDAHYMEAVQAMSGRGGWPMSVWLTPEGRPFFGGTYFPKPQFLHVLEQVHQAWLADRDRIEDAGAGLAAALGKAGETERAGDLDERLLLAFLDHWRHSFDPVHGGRAAAPKFPPAYDLQLLLRIHRRSGDRASVGMVTRTLDAMAAGGVYDHVGGGFHRYSTDERWLVPHFEKMLYDQAALTGAYLDAFLATGDGEYELVVRETLDYVLRDMTSPTGGFYSAEDADSEGCEGKFYVWTSDELRRLLDPAEFDELAAALGVRETGNFEDGATILNLQSGRRRTNRGASLSAALGKLRAARERRVRPHRDDKILTDWNGLMIGAMARAGRALSEPRYVAGAAAAARFLLAHLTTSDGRLLHRWRDGEAGIRGFLDDYAFLVLGLIELHQADFDPAWLDAAQKLHERQNELFWDDARQDYFTTDGANAEFLSRRVEAWDNVTPAGRSVAAFNSLRLADLLGETNLARRAGQVFASTPRVVRQAPMGFAFLLAALDYALDRSKEIAVVGPLDVPATRALLSALRSGFRPNQVLSAGPAGPDAPPLLRDRAMKDGRPTAYVCENGACSSPTNDPAEAARLAGTFRPLPAP